MSENPNHSAADVEVDVEVEANSMSNSNSTATASHPITSQQFVDSPPQSPESPSSIQDTTSGHVNSPPTSTKKLGRNLKKIVSQSPSSSVTKDATSAFVLASATVTAPHLFIHLIEGRDLASKDSNGLSDPYAQFQLRDTHWTSSTLFHTLIPRWNQLFLVYAPHSSSYLEVKFWDKDSYKRDDFMGRVSIPLQSLTDEKVSDKWYNLSPSPDETKSHRSEGAVRLRLQYILSGTVQFDKATRDTWIQKYTRFAKLVMPPASLPLISLAKQMSVSEINKLSSSLVNACHPSTLISLIKKSIEFEVSSCTDSKILFRGNSLSTKLMHHLGRTFGRHFLKDSLSAFLSNIIDDNVPMEIHPLRLAKLNQLQTNQNNVLASLDSLFKILMNHRTLPPLLSQITNHVYMHIVEKFPEEELVSLRCVASFTFLRFILPALTCPDVYGIVSRPISHRARGNLVLIAKSLQALANLRPFDQSVTQSPHLKHMGFIKDWVTTNTPAMKALLLDFSSPPPDPQNSGPAPLVPLVRPKKLEEKDSLPVDIIERLSASAIAFRSLVQIHCDFILAIEKDALECSSEKKLEILASLAEIPEPPPVTATSIHPYTDAQILNTTVIEVTQKDDPQYGTDCNCLNPGFYPDDLAPDQITFSADLFNSTIAMGKKNLSSKGQYSFLPRKRNLLSFLSKSRKTLPFVSNDPTLSGSGSSPSSIKSPRSSRNSSTSSGLTGDEPIDWHALAQTNEWVEYSRKSAALQKVNLAELDTAPKKHAFWANVYHCLLFSALELYGPIRYSAPQIFIKPKFLIDNHLFSLDDIEFGILRGNISSPRQIAAKKNNMSLDDFCSSFNTGVGSGTGVYFTPGIGTNIPSKHKSSPNRPRHRFSDTFRSLSFSFLSKTNRASSPLSDTSGSTDSNVSDSTSGGKALRRINSSTSPKKSVPTRVAHIGLANSISSPEFKIPDNIGKIDNSVVGSGHGSGSLLDANNNTSFSRSSSEQNFSSKPSPSLSENGIGIGTGSPSSSLSPSNPIGASSPKQPSPLNPNTGTPESRLSLFPQTSSDGPSQSNAESSDASESGDSADFVPTQNVTPSTNQSLNEEPLDYIPEGEYFSVNDPRKEFVCSVIDPRLNFILSKYTLSSPILRPLYLESYGRTCDIAAADYLRRYVEIEKSTSTITLPICMATYASEFLQFRDDIVDYLGKYLEPMDMFAITRLKDPKFIYTPENDDFQFQPIYTFEEMMQFRHN